MEKERITLTIEHILMGSGYCAYRNEMIIIPSLISYKRCDINKKIFCE